MSDVSECVMSNRLLSSADKTAAWEAIVVEDQVEVTIKDRLLRGMMLNLSHRRALPFESTALHGLILLYGPPGTGKTTLARGAAHQLCSHVPEQRVRLIEVNIHGLVSGGRDPMAIYDLLSIHVPQQTEERYSTVVVLDEVESIAVSRSEATLSANSADVHRATNAVLAALDHNAARQPRMLTIATSNFVSVLDEAFQSRVDMAIEMPLPGPRAIARILYKTLMEFATGYPQLGTLARDPALMEVANQLKGTDGRQIRKAVVDAMAVREAVAANPNLLSIEDLRHAATQVFVQKREPSLGAQDFAMSTGA